MLIIKSVIILLSCALGAALLFAVQTERIIFTHTQPIYAAQKSHNTTSCTLYWHKHQLLAETQTIIQTDDTQQNLLCLVNTWLHFLYTEDIHKRVHAETVTLSPSNNELFISFDRYPFGKQQSIEEKLGYIQSLCKTIVPHTAARKIRFLVHHTSLYDVHLDFADSWLID